MKATQQLIPAIVLVLTTSLFTPLYAQIEGVAKPGIILSVNEIDVARGPALIRVGGLQEGVLIYIDRDDSQKWESLPVELIGADYIQTANDNADRRDDNGKTIEFEVEVVELTILHMFIADKLIARGGAPPFPWMNEDGSGAEWFDTGEQVVGGDGAQDFSVWSTEEPLAAGFYTFRQMPVDATFYGIAATAFERPVICVELQLEIDEFTLRARDTAGLRVTCIDAEGTPFQGAGGTTYASDNEGVATVDANGVITAAGRMAIETPRASTWIPVSL